MQLPERWGVELADLQEATAEDDEDGLLRDHCPPPFPRQPDRPSPRCLRRRSTALIDECLNAVPGGHITR